MSKPMNLNEECLLQFLTGPNGAESQEAGAAIMAAYPISSELKRIYRRDRYVSFPPAILIRRQ